MIHRMFQPVKARAIGLPLYKRAMQGEFLFIQSPSDRRWHIYSEVLDLFLYESFRSEKEAKDYEIKASDWWYSDDI